MNADIKGALNQINKRDEALACFINNMGDNIKDSNKTIRRVQTTSIIALIIIFSVITISYFFSDYGTTNSNYNENKNITETIGGENNE